MDIKLILRQHADDSDMIEVLQVRESYFDKRLGMRRPPVTWVWAVVNKDLFEDADLSEPVDAVLTL